MSFSNLAGRVISPPVSHQPKLVRIPKLDRRLSGLPAEFGASAINKTLAKDGCVGRLEGTARLTSERLVLRSLWTQTNFISALDRSWLRRHGNHPWEQEEQGRSKEIFSVFASTFCDRTELSPVFCKGSNDTVGIVERAGELLVAKPVHAHAVAWNRLLSG